MSHLLAVLKEARAALLAVTVEPTQAALVRTLTRELDEALGRLDGSEPERDLVSIVCHDLKDPLASIVMGAGFLRKAISPDDSAARRVVEAIYRSAERMGLVISDFHDVAKLEAGVLSFDPRPLDVAITLRGAMAPLEAQAHARNVALTLEAPSTPVVAMCDPARLVQIVTKLVGNALKFTPPEGAIVIRIEGEAAKVRVSVSDTGRGIPPDNIASIFDRAANARRSPRDGPGLGLPIVRGLVELHGGEISVESRVGEGSVFSLTLPRA
jgi:two-component system, OmpR family, phosphate regulon sensor histidine kinase PhoR